MYGLSSKMLGATTVTRKLKAAQDETARDGHGLRIKGRLRKPGTVHAEVSVVACSAQVAEDGCERKACEPAMEVPWEIELVP